MYKKAEFLFIITICLFIIMKNVHSFDYDKCDPMRCSRGPIRFYEDMYCKPIYFEKGDCCPEKYDCSEVKKYDVNDYCFINGKAYRINEEVDENDIPEKKECYCTKNRLNIPNINCNGWKCPEVRLPRSKKNCYIKYSNEKCKNEVVCPEDPLECEINGEKIKEGESDFLKGNPFKECFCQEEIEDGRKVAKLFCNDVKNYCHSEFLFRLMFTENNAPLYYSDSHIHPQTYCPAFSKAYQKGDQAIRKEISAHYGNCSFGPLQIPFSSRLNRYNTEKNTYSCAICKCVIPPTLTCQVTPLAECEEKFEEFKRKNSDYSNELNNCELIDKDL
ncbi:uncharacterized protein LOC122505559 isoform X2 [Leptopilina heterotoma]|uniref:uncharacterized protein LOC122505559 isoform X2 n=1 Tax=Leptopilina heterotoma TaxID=63436 RepID=UPI001CA9AF6D|nr:uncharacterized protein LOC122505559 isoform X2 [Leptopilina heterotoma]